jgi:dTDP-4-dehydrorhamnose reductase
MRAFLFGSSGMLGNALARTVPHDTAVLGPALPRVDITDQKAVAIMLETLRPDVVINAAAFTRVDDAERETSRAMAVNGTAPGLIAKACAVIGARLVHVSTDYVFAGDATRPYREDDATRPLNCYGESKRHGERAVLESRARSLVVRTQWLFGDHGRSFPSTMWERARAGLPSRVVDDQRGRPTYATDVATAIWRLIALEADGIIHVANEGEASWYDVARAVYAAADREALVSACTTADFPMTASRPQYSVLDTSRLESLFGERMPRWENALRRYLALQAGATATAAK